MTTTRQSKTAGTGAKTKAPSPEVLQAAYEIHTLAEMIRGQLAATGMPWSAPVPPTGPFEQPTAWMSPIAPEHAAPWNVPTHWPW